MTTPAATRAATLARLREYPGFAEVWNHYDLYHGLAGSSDIANAETLCCLAYEIGRGDALDQVAAILGKPREVAL